MKVSTTSLENCQAVLAIEAEAPEMEKAMEQAYRRLVRTVSVPGFRPGKAPRPILERHIGKAALAREVINYLVPETYQNALKESGLEAIAEPEIDITKMEPVTFRAVVPLRPKVELGDYSQIRVPLESAPVSQEEIDKALEQMRQEQAPWEPMDRPVQMGDLVTLDVAGQVEDRAILNQKGLQYEAKANSPFPVPGFAEQLAGMGKGEEKEFPLSIPEDYPREEWRGKPAHFTVKVIEVKGKKLASLDDEFAKGVNLPSLVALRERVEEKLKDRAEAQAQRQAEETALSALLDISQLEFPPVLVEREIDHMLRGKGLNPQPRANPHNPEARQEVRAVATERVKRSLALTRLADLEKIEVSPQEIEAEVERMAQGSEGRSAEVRHFFSAPAVHQNLKDSLITRKTLERLLEIATGRAQGEPQPAKEGQGVEGGKDG